jgi:hypothetical protein
VFVIIRSVTNLDGSRPRTEVVYGITSLDTDRGSPKRLLRLVRGHWRIENCAHWVRDVTFNEDRCQVRTGAGPRVWACLRNLATGVLRLTGHANIAAGLRDIAWDRDQHTAFALLGI